MNGLASESRLHTLTRSRLTCGAFIKTDVHSRMASLHHAGDCLITACPTVMYSLRNIIRRLRDQMHDSKGKKKLKKKKERRKKEKKRGILFSLTIVKPDRQWVRTVWLFLVYFIYYFARQLLNLDFLDQWGAHNTGWQVKAWTSAI